MDGERGLELLEVAAGGVGGEDAGLYWVWADWSADGTNCGSDGDAGGGAPTLRRDAVGGVAGGERCGELALSVVSGNENCIRTNITILYTFNSVTGTYCVNNVGTVLRPLIR